MKLLWIDIETTSLHPDAGTILELAYAVADLADPFNPEPGLDVVLRFTDDQAEMLSPAVRRMHTENGLLAECRRSLLGVADLRAWTEVGSSLTTCGSPWKRQNGSPPERTRMPCCWAAAESAGSPWCRGRGYA